MQSPVPTTTAHKPVDGLGIVAGTTCAVHCLFAAVLPTAVSSMGLSTLLEPEAEWALALCVAGIAGWAAWVHARQHGPRFVVLALGCGALGVLLARVLEAFGAGGLGAGLSVASGVILVLGHIQGIRAQRARLAPGGPPCRHCTPR